MARKPKGPKFESKTSIELLPEKEDVASYVEEVVSAKKRKSKIGEELHEAIELAKERGIDITATNLATRFYTKALEDPLKARVLYENFHYVLFECLDFDKIAPAGMFDVKGDVQVKVLDAAVA
jgi:hypothetical protein